MKTKKKVRKRYQPGTFVTTRARVLGFGLFAAFGLLGARAILIHLYPNESNSLSKMASRQYQKQMTLAPYRGTIYDHRREPLAISIRMPSFFVNPKIFEPNREQIANLVNLLDLDRKHIVEITKKNSYFAWLKRKVHHANAKRVLEMNIPGLYQVDEPARFYPAGSSAANLLGYVGMDDAGLGGIERQYNKTIGGTPVSIDLAKDARGQIIISEHENATPEQAGDNLYLTIDRAIQEIAERELAQGVANAKAKGGFAIVADPHSGRILALANNPYFDPNNPRQINLESTKNQALLNSFEPGSVIKPLVVALAMDEKLLHEKQLFDCENGRITIGKHIIRDSHPPRKPMLTTEEVVMQSSNVCMYKIAKLLGPEKLQDGLNRFGIGARLANTGFPGEISGRLSSWQTWAPVRFANIAFGQGLTSTGLEVVQAYSAFANGGQIVKPYLLDRIEGSDGSIKFVNSPQIIQRVIDPNTARRIRSILFRTVEEGAVNAKLDMYTAGGKTGTSQKVDPVRKAYSHEKHLSSFVGLAPVNDPHVVVYVQIDEPNQPQSYGSLWAAPVFRQITEKTLSYLNVAPDRPRDMKSIAIYKLDKPRHDTATQ